MSTRHRKRGRTPALVLGAALAPGCQADEPMRTAPADPAAPQGPLPGQPLTYHAPTVDRIQEEPALFFGKEVRLAGAVDELFDERAFELEGSGWAFGDNITVLARTPVRFGEEPLARGDDLVVTGLVRPFGSPELERELGWSVPEALARRLKARPVLVATAIRKVAQFGPEQSWDAGGEVRTSPPIATVFTIVTTEPVDALIGREVNLRSERVREVVGRGLWIGPSDKSQVFVLAKTPPAGIEAGDLVHVSGTLRAMPRDARSRWGMPQEAAYPLLKESYYVEAAEVHELAPGPAEPRPGV